MSQYVFDRKYAIVHCLKMLRYVMFGIQITEITPLFICLKCLGMYFLDRKYAVAYWLKMLQYTLNVRSLGKQLVLFGKSPVKRFVKSSKRPANYSFNRNSDRKKAIRVVINDNDKNCNLISIVMTTHKPQSVYMWPPDYFLKLVRQRV